jgi:hypothetical protein
MDVKAEIIKNLLYLKEIGLTSIPASEAIKRLLQREISLEKTKLFTVKNVPFIGLEKQWFGVKVLPNLKD